MGQKVNPVAFRLAVNKDWRSKWFAAGKDYTDKLHEDLAIPDDCIAVLEIGPARPQGLYFRPLQSQTGLIGLMDKEIMTCLAILASNLHANVFLSQMVSPFPFDRNL